MWYSKLRAAAVIPALFAACIALATLAHAVPATPPALLPNQQDGVFITDAAGRTYSFQTALEPGQLGCLLNQCEFFRGFGIANTAPRTPAGFKPGIVFLTFPGENDLSGLTGAPAGTSDALALTSVTLLGVSRVSAFFISDGAGPILQGLFNNFATSLPVLGSLRENGQWQDLTNFFVPGSNGLIFVQSDVDVPEPASLALLGSALIGFAVVRRRKQA